MTKYTLELWNPIQKKYIQVGIYSSIERAEIMFNKPYMRQSTRRLYKVTTDLLMKQKLNKYGQFWTRLK